MEELYSDAQDVVPPLVVIGLFVLIVLGRTAWDRHQRHLSAREQAGKGMEPRAARPRQKTVKTSLPR